jgi:hypothetical protein
MPICVPPTAGGRGGWLRLVIDGDATEAPVDHLRGPIEGSRACAGEAGRATWNWETRRKTSDLYADVDAGEKPRLEEECFQGWLAR